MNRTSSLIVAALSACILTSPQQVTANSVEEGQVKLAGGSLFHRVVGEGPPLVIVHGGPNLDFRYLYEPLLPLADQNRLVFYDQRGLGASESSLAPDLITLEQYVRDLDELRAAHGFHQISLLGHSWGGLLAMAYAWTYPDRVSSLVLVSTIEPGTRFAGALRESIGLRMSSADRARLEELRNSAEYQRGDPASVEEVLQISLAVGAAQPSRIRSMALNLTERTAKNGNQVVSLLFRDPDAFDNWARLAQIGAPTLVVHGAHDALPARFALDLAGEIPKADVVVMGAAGHFPFIEAPESFFAYVEAFLSANPTRGSKD